MSLTHIEHGSLASSSVINDNFEYLDDRITGVSNDFTSISTGIQSSLASMNSTLTQDISDLVTDISDLAADLDELEASFEAKDDAPDYTRGISIESLPYTAEADGYINVSIAAHNCISSLYINGAKVGHAHSAATTYYSMISGQYRVKSGDVISYTNGRFQWMSFFPLKGGED